MRACSSRFKTRICAIDDGTIYDVPGSLEKLARSIRDGTYGEVTEAVVCIEGKNRFGHRGIEGFFYGVAPDEKAYVILERVQTRILGE